jgi:hypothetical protein
MSLAVATDSEGVPLHVSILRGNRNDTQTLQGLLHTLRRRFGITTATFVFAGGMSSQAQSGGVDGGQPGLCDPALHRHPANLGHGTGAGKTVGTRG